MRTVYSILLTLGLVAVVGASISCYQCNTGAEGQDNCDTSDVSELAAYKKTCPKGSDGEFEGKEAIACRKILQSVSEESSVIRECAYSGENVDGQKKTGNWGISLYYYQCENAKPDEPCNGASAVSMFSALLLIAYSLLF